MNNLMLIEGWFRTDPYENYMAASRSWESSWVLNRGPSKTHPQSRALIAPNSP